MARYSKAFKAKAVARLLPPESATLEDVSAEMGVRADTLSRWRAEALSDSQDRLWTGPARLEAVIHTASLDEAGRSTWCRENGVYPAELEQWRAQASESLSDVSSGAGSSKAERQSRQEIRKLQRDLARKDKALAETAALLVLSKKLEAIFHESGDE
jgi:transposase-like protein